MSDELILAINYDPKPEIAIADENTDTVWEIVFALQRILRIGSKYRERQEAAK